MPIWGSRCSIRPTKATTASTDRPASWRVLVTGSRRISRWRRTPAAASVPNPVPRRTTCRRRCRACTAPSCAPTRRSNTGPSTRWAVTYTAHTRSSIRAAPPSPTTTATRPSASAWSSRTTAAWGSRWSSYVISTISITHSMPGTWAWSPISDRRPDEEKCAMSNIGKESAPAAERLDALGVATWPIWTKEVSTFPWTYESEETCYFLEGEVVVTPAGGAPVRMGKGDLVVFPAGLRCVLGEQKTKNKHYRGAGGGGRGAGGGGRGAGGGGRGAGAGPGQAAR